MKSSPAFPSHGSMGEVTHEGMTLRDYFAAKAISAAFSGQLPDKLYCEVAAERAYHMADAMLKAREA